MRRTLTALLLLVLAGCAAPAAPTRAQLETMWAGMPYEAQVDACSQLAQEPAAYIRSVERILGTQGGEQIIRDYAIAQCVSNQP